MDKKKKSTAGTATVSIEPSDKVLDRLPYARIVQNFLVLWLDESIDELDNDDCRNAIVKLRKIANIVNTFTDADQCIDFVTDIKEEKVFMVVSGALSRSAIPIAQDISQVSSIYIFCGDKTKHETWAQQWPKVKGVFTDITIICETLEQAAQQCDKNMVSISFVKPNDGASKKTLDQLDQSFMYTQILKDILLTIDFDQGHINEFLTYCREQFNDNNAQLQCIEKFRKEYHLHKPIWWYTSTCFLYSMLNSALRTMEVDLIIRMGFFVRDLHEHIVALHIEQYGGRQNTKSFIVFRGQGLSQTDFDQLVQTQGGLLSFNNFLSTSLDRTVSLVFAESNHYNSDLIGVFFEIFINPSTSSTFFANIHDVSAYQAEEEILFSMHSVFRIGQIKQIEENSCLWKVELTLTNDSDPQLHAVTKSMQEEIKEVTGWHRLGQLMLRLGHFNKAEELYDILLRQTTDESEKAHLFHHLGYIKDGQGKYEEAIEFYEKALEIYQKTLPPNHPALATSYNNIGTVYKNMGEYSKALSYYEKDLEICQKTVPPNYLSLATSYNNIGLLYDNVGQYPKALSYYEKDLEIKQKTLPPNHPDLATSYSNIGSVYYSMGEYSKALSYYEKDLEICQKTLPPNHPTLATSYNNIGLLYNNIGQYPNALSYHEKALEIRQKTLPPNHPTLATSYNNIGSVYQNMDEYPKALSYYEKALEIRQKTLPPNHPHLATSYSNIGLLYDNIGQYPKALSYFEKALEIRQKTFPPNHLDLAISYNNIGSVYKNMGEYSKAFTFYECALETGKHSLPSNHPYLQSIRESIKVIKQKL